VNRRPLLAMAAVAGGLAITACGGSSAGTSSQSSSSSAAAPSSSATTPSSSSSASSAAPKATAGAALSLAADPSGQLRFTKSALTATAGKVSIKCTNSASLPHNLTVQQGSNGPVLGATPTFEGGTKTLTLQLKRGTYTFYCSVPGHRQAGMQGTLTVQ